MQFSTLAFFFSASAIATSVSVGKRGCHSISGSPFSDCGHKDDILKFTKIQFKPSRPKRGDKVTAYVKGSLESAINEEANLEYSYSLNGNELGSGEQNICKAISQHKYYRCPIEAKDIDFTKEFVISKYAPSGNYSFTVIARQGYNQILNLRGEYTL